MSINTTQGWNAMAKRENTKSFIRVHGRPPRSDAELAGWVRDPNRHAGISNEKEMET